MFDKQFFNVQIKMQGTYCKINGEWSNPPKRYLEREDAETKCKPDTDSDPLGRCYNLCSFALFPLSRFRPA